MDQRGFHRRPRFDLRRAPEQSLSGQEWKLRRGSLCTGETIRRDSLRIGHRPQLGKTRRPGMQGALCRGKPRLWRIARIAQRQNVG
jgi:hypothetical protein